MYIYVYITNLYNIKSLHEVILLILLILLKIKLFTTTLLLNYLVFKSWKLKKLLLIIQLTFYLIII